MKKITIFLFGVCLVLQLVAQEQHYFMNPVIRGRHARSFHHPDR